MHIVIMYIQTILWGENIDRHNVIGNLGVSVIGAYIYI